VGHPLGATFAVEFPGARSFVVFEGPVLCTKLRELACSRARPVVEFFRGEFLDPASTIFQDSYSETHESR
jgi:hypothetical protein